MGWGLGEKKRDQRTESRAPATSEPQGKQGRQSVGGWAAQRSGRGAKPKPPEKSFMARLTGESGRVLVNNHQGGGRGRGCGSQVTFVR